MRSRAEGVERPAPVTVAELVAALSTYPPEALVFTSEAGTGCGSIDVETPAGLVAVWEGVTSAGNWYDGDSASMLRAYETERPKPYDPTAPDRGPLRRIR